MSMEDQLNTNMPKSTEHQGFMDADAVARCSPLGCASYSDSIGEGGLPLCPLVRLLLAWRFVC